MELRKFIKTTIHEYVNEQQETKNNINKKFWKWFGNSKVVNDNGIPIIVYHGTDNNNFNTFKISKYGSLGRGIYLTPYKEIAEGHGKYLMELYVRIEDETDGIIAGYEVVVKKQQNIKSIYNDGSWDLDDKNIYS